MLFNSFEFLIFFPSVILVYFAIPKKMRYLWLLAASYFFYMRWNAKYALLLLFSTSITWISGILMDRISQKEWEKHRILREKKKCVAASFILNLSILFFFKYYDFTIESLNYIFRRSNVEAELTGLNLILPVGISFYIFQALSYTVDVYREEIKAEHNFLRYALFVSFFPQLVAGPIERSRNLLMQLNNMEHIKLWNYRRIREGLQLMLWGFFQKLVIADRAALVVNRVFDNYQSYGFVELAVAAVLFSFQIYCDFAGYSIIAKGSAQVMGLELMNNFSQPYFAKDIKDFWRRWHISLTSWFTDYLYIPLGGNRKGESKRNRNILIVFLCSGLWHGANWTYVVWGFFHGCAQIVTSCFGRKNAEEKGKIWNLIKTGATFGLVTVFWIFFRADSLHHALGYIRQASLHRRLQTFTKMGMSTANWIVLIVAIILLLCVDYLHEKGVSIRKELNCLHPLFRMTICILAIWLIILFGIYGYQYDASQFIYFQF